MLDSTCATKIGSSGSTTGKLNGTSIRTITGLSIPVKAGIIYYAYMSMPAAFGSSAPGALLTNPAVGNAVSLLGSSAGDVTGMTKTGLTVPLVLPVSSPAAATQVPVLGLRKS